MKLSTNLKGVALRWALFGVPGIVATLDYGNRSRRVFLPQRDVRDEPRRAACDQRAWTVAARVEPPGGAAVVGQSLVLTADFLVHTVAGIRCERWCCAQAVGAAIAADVVDSKARRRRGAGSLRGGYC